MPIKSTKKTNNNNKKRGKNSTRNKIDLNNLDKNCNQEFATILKKMGGSPMQCILILIKNDREVIGSLSGHVKKYQWVEPKKLVVVEPIDGNCDSYIIKYVCTDHEKKKLKKEGRLKKNTTVNNNDNNEINNDIQIGSNNTNNKNKEDKEFDSKFIEEITKEGIAFLDI
jgi:hypothetical protein